MGAPYQFKVLTPCCSCGTPAVPARLQVQRAAYEMRLQYDREGQHLLIDNHTGLLFGSRWLQGKATNSVDGTSVDLPHHLMESHSEVPLSLVWGEGVAENRL